MRLSNVREAACIRASFLLNQANSKKGFKAIQPEIAKNSEIFGIEFDKHIYKSLIDEIDFKDIKALLANKNASNKLQYFLQEFPSLLERQDFTNIFAQILMTTTNTSSCTEIFEGLNKLIKLSYDNQFKIIISFIYSMNERFTEDARNILMSKCHEFHKETKVDQLTSTTLQTLMLLINSLDPLKNDNFFTNTFLNFLVSSQKDDENAQISDLEGLMSNMNSNSTADNDESIEFEKVLHDLGPLIINNGININKNELIDTKIDEKRLAGFILFLSKHQIWVEDKENRYLNKVFLKSLNNDLSMTIDENTEKKINVNWNIDSYYKIFKTQIDALDTTILMSYFDDPSFSIKDKKSFEYLVSTLLKLKISNYQNLLFNLIYKKWNNEINQIEFLNFLINNNLQDIFSFKNALRKVKKNFELNITLNKNSSNHLVEAWSSIDLIEILLKLSKGNFYLKVKEMFDWPLVNAPELLVIALASIKTEGDEFLYDELINETLPLFLGNHVNSIVVLEEVWNLNKELVIKTICNLYRSNPDLMNLSRILDITQKLKESLIPIVSCNDHNFTVNLAILAVKRDFLHIDQWLQERIGKVGDDFIECLLNYIKENVISQCKDVTSQSIKENILEKCQLSLESLAIIFENLTPNKIGNNPKVSKRIETEITNTYKAIFEIFDELQVQPPNSEEIEDAANKLYQNLFHNEISVGEIIEKMKSYKNSQCQKESEIYACMIHSLLDEYRFFHQYPERELTIIATLFGQIINQKLLDGIIETIALKYVMEGLKKGTGNMFIFATTALEQFVDKLNNWPQYLNSLIGLPSLKNNPTLMEKIQEKINEVTNKNRIKDEVTLNTSSNSMNTTNQNIPMNIIPGLNQREKSQNFSHPQTNFVNFETNQIDEKRGEKINLATVSKMPDFNKQDFNSAFRNANAFPSNINSMIPPGYRKEGAGVNYMNQFDVNNTFNMPNMYYPNPQANPATSQGIKPQSQLLNKEKELKDEMQEIQNYIGESYENYGIDDKNDYNMKNQKNIASFNSGDKSSFSNNKIKLSNKPVVTSNMVNLSQILGSENESTVQAPPQDIIDKINFIFNSMSKNNITDKSNELKNILSNDNIIRWFSNFFIVNRVSAENNNHQIYNELITMIDSRDLNQLLIRDTISYIRKLLLSENIKDNKERNVLKNLGSWLGIMTLAKNKPILAKDLDMKEIIFDAYENGKLIAIITFVCRILDHSAKTKVFHPKNPWIQAILSVLSELYTKPYLKNSLKFEVENIFKKLEVDLSNYPQSRLLDSIIVFKDSPDFTKPQSEMQSSQSSSELNLNDLYNRVSLQDQYLSDLINNINRNGNVVSKQDILSIITNSLGNAINEILSPVVERAVNISLVTTRELILKDFAFEKDEIKFKNAANLCIKSLAGSLAMVTCKEPLRIGYNNQLKENLVKKGLEIEFIETINNTLNNTEILEIGCTYIQNYVIKRAIDKIEKDRVIIEELEKRRKQKSLEIRGELLSKIKSLPEVLRPNTQGLSQEQYKIYEDFDRVYDHGKKENISNKIALLKMIVPALKEFLDSYTANQNAPKIINKYEICMFNIQYITKNNETTEYADEDEQITILSKMISESKVNEMITMELVNVTFKQVVSASKVQNLSLVNINSEILKGWIKLYPSLKKEITIKLLNSEDIQIRFKLDIHYYFFKKGIFEMSEYENFISTYLEEASMNSIVRKLISSLIEKNVLNVSQFKKIPNYMVDPALSVHYWDLFAKKTNFSQAPPSFTLTDWKTCNIRDYNSYLTFKDMCSKFTFKQLLNIIYQNNSQESLKESLKNFIESSIVKSEEQMNAFIMIFTEFAIKSVLFYEPENNITPESEAKCIVVLMNIIPTNKLKFFENILFGIFKVFHYDYTKNITTMTFNQRPYYKLFMNIIHLIYTAESNDELFNGYKKIQYFNILADIMRILKPQNYPGFALAWIDILSSKYFTGMFLENETGSKLSKENFPRYEKFLLLIIDLLSYLKAFNNEVIVDYNSKVFIDFCYKFVFLLSNSYPEFLSYYYYIIIASLPNGDSFLQMKNIILHCAPSEIEQPDPFYDEFKVDSLPDIRKNSIVLFDIGSILNEYGYKAIIDEYIESKNESLLEEIFKKLNKKERDSMQNYLIINAIVIYWSQNVIKAISEKRKMSNQEVLEFFIKMMRNLDPDNRDHLINSILNELRYPSNQTYYFSCLLLCIFFEIKNEQIEEHILRNILERLLYKPYPWGILVTFVELSRHPKYELSKKNYINQTHCDKIIEELVKFIKSSKLNKNLDNYVA